MQRFARLYRELDRHTATGDKLQVLEGYFREAPAHDAAWALHLLCGGKATQPGKPVARSAELRAWMAEASGTPAWLVEASYEQVGDLAETLALLLDDPPDAAPDAAPDPAPDPGLAAWIEQRLLPVAGAAEEARRAVVVQAWRSLPFEQRLVFNKLLTGALRVGVSQRLVQQALARLSGLDIARIAQRMLGRWTPSAAFLNDLLSPHELPADRRQPYPFFLASPLEADAAALGEVSDWQVEWKWDGIRLQLIRRDGEVALWSRGEERLDGRFPEIEQAAARLPADCVIDGELLAWHEGQAHPAPFQLLQTRIQRRRPGPKTLAQAPVRLLAYDLLEHAGQDCRSRPLHARRHALMELLAAPSADAGVGSSAAFPIAASPALPAPDWPAVARWREQARARGTEGLMLKRTSSPYQVGRRRGDWWKWKLDPLSVDAVLLYAQAGHGRRSTLYTDYTFALWDGAALVPVAKAYSGLDDREILALDRWIRAHTRERFGPVRSVEPVQVFEIAFEAVMHSTRHKSGVAVRFPRILRWRQDKPAQEADHLEALRALAR